MNVLDLFSGIGGFSLGLERAGMRTVAFCEIDPYCRAVLAKHWPGIPIHHDVRKLTAADVPGVDVICGGFPCQDISTAGKGAGIEGERSGLWSEYARLIGEIRPRFVIVENVAALLGRGLGRVLGDFSALGFDAEWHCIPASAVGAPHIRDRLWLVAYPSSADAGCYAKFAESLESLIRQSAQFLPDASGDGLSYQPNNVADAESGGMEEQRLSAKGRRLVADTIGSGGRRQDSNADSEPQKRIAIARRECNQWHVEPDVGRVAHGIPARVDRLRGLGNAVVPQIPEIIGRAIMQAEGLK